MTHIEVVDEWAAVLRHQDEVSKETESREKEQQREKQKHYREELAKQRAEAESKNRLEKQQRELEELSALEFSSGFLKISSEAERLRDAERKAVASQLVEESIKEKRRVKQLEKERDLRENQAIMDAMRQRSYEEQLKKQEEQNMKQLQQEELRRTYELQEQMKQKNRQEEKTRDAIYLSEEQQQEAKRERDRQRYFAVLREKQRLADGREKLYLNYSPAKLQDLQRQDEISHLKAVQASLRQARDEQVREAELKNRVTWLRYLIEYVHYKGSAGESDGVQEQGECQHASGRQGIRGENQATRKFQANIGGTIGAEREGR